MTIDHDDDDDDDEPPREAPPRRQQRARARLLADNQMNRAALLLLNNSDDDRRTAKHLGRRPVDSEQKCTEHGARVLPPCGRSAPCSIELKDSLPPATRLMGPHASVHQPTLVASRRRLQQHLTTTHTHTRKSQPPRRCWHRQAQSSAARDLATTLTSRCHHRCAVCALWVRPLSGATKRQS